MTLEINEINIQISIQPPAPQSLLPLAMQPSARAALPQEQIDQVVRRCVRDVLQHLQLRERR
jgi:Family of unknown function (DUF5908)